MSTQITSQLLSIVLQIVLFAMVPFLWWAVTARKKKISFFHWIGLHKPELKVKWYYLLLFIVVYLIWYNVWSVIMLKVDSSGLLLTSHKIEANAYSGLGASAILISFIQAFLQNGLSEELLFRGFLLKRFSAKFGKIFGWLISSILFGLTHNILAMVAGIPFNFPTQISIFIFVSGGGFLLAILNEKVFNGSIFPSIVFHGCGDFIGAMFRAFSL